VGVPSDPRAVLLLALRAQAGTGPHAELARGVLLWVLLAQLLASAQHDGPPHAAHRAPRDVRARRPGRLPRRGSITGRRPRG
jgi:hypothetical protein